MPMRFFLLFAAVLAIMPLGSIARAEWSLGRFLGYGWGDGYHSHSACPPRHAIGYGLLPVQRQPAALPWWATPVPAVEAEALPHPAAEPQPTTAPATPVPGASLFRQPGESSSVIVSSGANGKR